MKRIKYRITISAPDMIETHTVGSFDLLMELVAQMVRFGYTVRVSKIIV